MGRAGAGLGWLKRAFLGMLALLFIASGISHFAYTDAFAAIVPDYLPWHVTLVWVSGAAELLLAVGILAPATRRLAGLLLIALMVAVFPANVEMALHVARFPAIPSWLIFARLPLPGLMIAWANWVTSSGAQRLFPGTLPGADVRKKRS